MHEVDRSVHRAGRASTAATHLPIEPIGDVSSIATDGRPAGASSIDASHPSMARSFHTTNGDGGGTHVASQQQSIHADRVLQPRGDAAEQVSRCQLSIVLERSDVDRSTCHHQHH